MATYNGTANADTLVGAATSDDLYGLAANDSLSGGGGDDTLVGGAGADTLDGGSGNDLASYSSSGAVSVNLATGVGTGDAAGDVFISIEGLIGSALPDTLTGDAGNNSLSGGGANDVLTGGGGADTLDGGAGSLDAASYADASAGVSVNLQSGVHTGDAAGDVFIGIEGLIGSAFADTLTSSASINTNFQGGAGDDVYVLDASNASDIVFEAANQGTDEVRASAASYSIFGTSAANVENLTYIGTGNFIGTGNALANVLTGGSGDDTLDAGVGSDTLNGGSGFDMASYISAFTGNSSVGVEVNLATGVGTSEAAGDVFISIEGLLGSAYPDTLTGDAGNNSLWGGGANDVLIGGGGADTLDGGNGSLDAASYAGASAGVSINLATGVHTGDAAGDVFTAIEIWSGSAFADTLTSSASINTNFRGGAGDDVYFVDSSAAADSVFEAANQGTDEIRASSASYSIFGTSESNVENLTYIGTGNFIGMGNALANVLTGGSGDDTLEGNVGSDTLNGGAGNDMASYVSSALAVEVNLATGGGTNEAAGDVFISIEGLWGSAYADTLTGDAGANNLWGGGANDVLIGGGGADTLDGGNGSLDAASYAGASAGVSVNLATGVHTGDAAGDVFTAIEIWTGSAFADTLTSSGAIGTNFQGGAGDDVYVVDSTSDIIVEAAGQGADEVRSTAANYVLPTNVEKLSFAGSGNFTATGNSGVNALSGGSGNDVLIGGAGADTLDGGSGFDVASYSTSGAVSVNLATGAGTGDAAGDVFISIEGLIGSGATDTLIGNAGDNSLAANAGADLLEGGAGADTFHGGSNASAVIVTYAGAAAGVSLNLATGVHTGDAAGDTFISIVNWTGSAFADTLASSAAINSTFRGGAGNDVFVVDSISDSIVENAGEGIDEVRTTSTSYTLPANIEKLAFVGAGNFTGTGGASADAITGGAGNDILIGAAGGDTLDGAAGFDIVSYQNSSVGVRASLATGTGSAGDATGDVFIGIEGLIGSNGADTLIGDAGDNSISAVGANDIIEGGAGADTLNAGSSFGSVYASYAGANAGVSVNLATGVHTGDAAGDVFIDMRNLIGSAFADTLTSSASLTGIFRGGAGDDVYGVDSSSDAVTENAGEGFDEVRSTAGSYALSANIEKLTFVGSGNFSGSGSASGNLIAGGSGNDTLDGGAGADTLDGGSGVDVASYQSASAGVSVNLATGVGTGDAAGDTFISIEGLIGSNGVDTLIGDAGDNSITAVGANDVLEGGAGADAFNAGSSFASVVVRYAGASAGIGLNLETGVNTGDAAGDTFISVRNWTGSAFADTMTSSAAISSTFRGGGGDDVYGVDSSFDVVTENAGEGFDEVRSTAGSYALSANIEKLTFVGSGNFSGSGNASGNLIAGGSGNDTLDGGAGADTLDGGSGFDVASYQSTSTGVSVNLATGVGTGDAAGDTFISIEGLIGSNGVDTLIGDAGDNSITAVGANDVLEGGAGADAFNAGGSFASVVVRYAGASAGIGLNLETGVHTGDAAGDTFISVRNWTGSAFADTMTSSAAINSTFRGGAGNDVYVVDSVSDVVTENTGEGFDEVRTTNASYTLPANVERLVYVGSGNFTASGSTGGDDLSGGAGNDILSGNGGNDTLTGGAGNDTLNGGDGDDVLYGGAGADSFVGGIGVNVVSYATATASVSINISTGTHTGDAAGDTFTQIQVFQGTIYGDSFTSSSSVNTTFQGGDGDDVYVIDSASDTVIEAAGGGTDEIRSTANTYAIGNNVENFTFIGSGGATVTGNASANVIIGGSSNDVLDGGGGNDTIDGGGGIDVVSYASATAAVSIDISTGTNTGEAAGDSYTSIEIFKGTIYGDSFSSSSSSDTTFQGGAGDDVYIVDSSSDTVIELPDEGVDEIRTTTNNYLLTTNVEKLTYIGSGNFSATGNATNNTIVGGAGDDTIEGGGGGDVIVGGGGIDVASYASATAAVHINLSTGTHTGDAAGDSFTSIEKFYGSIFGDTFHGSSSEGHTFDGGEGTDVYYVDYSHDTVIDNGGIGDDEVRTTLNHYFTPSNIERLVFSGVGNATLGGNVSNNVITGGSGDDVIEGGGGADTIDGGGGIDVASYASATAAVSINLSTGSHTGDAAGDSFTSIEVFKGTIYGDLFTSSTSIDNRFEGGAGDDVYIVDDHDDAVIEINGEGDDEIRTTVNNHILENNVEKLTFIGSGNFLAKGNTSNNTITGGAGDDVIEGGGGADVIIGGIGIDVASYASATAAVSINISTGSHTGDAAGDTYTSIEIFDGTIFGDTFISSSSVNTTFEGGGGDDIYVVDSSSDLIVENLNDGEDEIRSTTNIYGLSNNVEKLTFIGSGNATLTGNTTNNLIIGGTGADSIGGDAGNDTLVGGGGGDSYDGGLDIDIVSYAEATAAVYVDINGNVFSGYASGSSFVSVEGFIGSVFADTLMGGTGLDTLWGNDGDDFLHGNTGNDTLYGGSGNDTLRGGQDDDIVSGGSGDDFVSGDRGNDTVTGGSGADIFHSWGAANVDRVLDFDYGEGDRVQLDAGTSYSLSQVGADTVVDMGGGNQVILVGVTLSSLPAGWIYVL